MPTLPPEGESVHASGATAEEVGKESAVERGTKSPTVAASSTTRDHEVIRAWAEARGGTPADVRGTDDSDVDLLYQERTSDGAVSRFHEFVRADG